MARGFLTGLVWGGLLGGIGLASLSVSYPNAPLIGTTPPIVGSQAPIGSMVAGEEVAILIEITPDAATDGAAPTALVDPASTILPEEIGSIDQIEVGEEAEVTLGEVADGQGPEVSAMSGGETPPDATSPAIGLDMPMNEAVPEAGSQPAMPDALTEAGIAADAPDGGQGIATAPTIDATPRETVPDPTAPATTEAQPDAQTPPAAQPAPPPAPPPVAPPRSTQPDTGSDSPGQPAGQIGDLAEGVTTNRLPSIGAGDSGEDALGGAGGDAALPAVSEGALTRNAQSFENPENQPTMAVVLMDIGSDRTQLGDLKNLPFAMAFVVDASAEDAAEAIAFYRSSGAEVVVSVPFPEGATPSDIEVTLAAYAPLLQDAVAMMAPKSANFQALGTSAIQVAVVLQASGHGLISIPQGLNTGHKSARKEGVAVGLIFRELDNDGQSGSVIRRFMDNAAFKARQNPGVILFGHARIETIQALIEWSLGSRAKSVALAPVSVVLAGN